MPYCQVIDCFSIGMPWPTGILNARNAMVRTNDDAQFATAIDECGQDSSRLEQVLNVPERVRLRPVLRLRPCWTAFLSILGGRCRERCLALRFILGRGPIGEIERDASYQRDDQACGK